MHHLGMFRVVKSLQKTQPSADSGCHESTVGSPSSSPISGKAIAAELEMAVLKKLKSNVEQVGTALVELVQESASPTPVPGSPSLDVYA